MGTYNVPRNLRGETRILVIFTLKSLATTGAGVLIGLLFFYFFSLLKLKGLGIGFIIFLHLLVLLLADLMCQLLHKYQ